MHIYKANKVIVILLYYHYHYNNKTNLFMFIFRLEERIVISQLVEVTVGKAL